MNTHERKKQLLGMSFGTASNKLRRSLMFELICKLDLNKCMRCGKLMTVDDYSIEHKKDWMYSEDPVSTFFDISNITFSHLKCNIGASRTKARRVVSGKTKYKGVYDRTNTGRAKPWQAQAWKDGKCINIGYYKTSEDAAKAYDKKVLELRGTPTITNKSLGLL